MRNYAKLCPGGSMATPYVHEDPSSRRGLAEALTSSLKARGFQLQAGGGHTEDVWCFIPKQSDYQKGQIIITVYTSILRGEVRDVGEDAIRVSCQYRIAGQRDRPLLREGRVNRVGIVEEIVDRLFARCRVIALKAKELPRCNRCGTPCFLAKSGKATCAAICWEKV